LRAGALWLLRSEGAGPSMTSQAVSAVAAPGPPSAPGEGSARGRVRAVRGREAELEAGASARSLVDRDRAAVRLRDLLDDREPEPRPRQRAGVRRAVEALEDVRAVLLGDAGAAVADAQDAARERDVDGRARRAPLRGVLEQVRDGPLEARRVALDGRLGERRGEGDAVVPVRRPLDRVEHELVEADRVAVEVAAAAPCELEQALDNPLHLLRLADEVVE